MYSLLSAATLGFDLVRLPYGPQVARVIRETLTADGEHHRKLASAQRAYAGLGERTVQRLESQPLQVRHILGLSTPSDGRSVVTQPDLTAAPLGTLASLHRMMLNEVLEPRGVNPSAEQAVLDAVTGWFCGDHLPSTDRVALVSPYCSALRQRTIDTTCTGDRRREWGVDDPATVRLLNAIQGLDEGQRDRWREAAKPSRHSRVGWAGAMHQTCRILDLTDRVVGAAAAQMAAVEALRTAGFTGTDAVNGVWNMVSGAVQAVMTQDLLADEYLNVLLAPLAWATQRDSSASS